MATLDERLSELMAYRANEEALRSVVWGLKETATMIVRCPNIVVKSGTFSGEAFAKALKMLNMDQRADLYEDICLWLATDLPEIDYNAYKY